MESSFSTKPPPARYVRSINTAVTAPVAGFETQRPEQIQHSFQQAVHQNEAKVNMSCLGAECQGGYESLLARAFFSAQNTNALQQALSDYVHQQIGRRTAPQSLQVLYHHMVDVFSNYLRGVDTDDADYVRSIIPVMNSHLVRACGASMVENIKHHLFTLQTRSQLTGPSSRPSSTTEDRVMHYGRFV